MKCIHSNNINILQYIIIGRLVLHTVSSSSRCSEHVPRVHRVAVRFLSPFIGDSVFVPKFFLQTPRYSWWYQSLIVYTLHALEVPVLHPVQVFLPDLLSVSVTVSSVRRDWVWEGSRKRGSPRTSSGRLLSLLWVCVGWESNFTRRKRSSHLPICFSPRINNREAVNISE